MYSVTTILGRAGKDPEMRYTQNGKAVTNLSVAADVGFGDNKKTIWFRVSFWDKIAEIVNNSVRKGDKIFVTGELTPDDSGNPRTWTKQDGTTSASFEVNANQIRFLEPKRESVSDPAWSQDDVPF